MKISFKMEGKAALVTAGNATSTSYPYIVHTMTRPRRTSENLSSPGPSDGFRVLTVSRFIEKRQRSALQ